MSTPTPDDYAAEGRAWFEAHAQRRRDDSTEESTWGVGSDEVTVFHALTFEEERAVIRRAQTWQQLKCDAGFGAVTRPIEDGGAGLGPDHAHALGEVERLFETPESHEVFNVTTGLVAPTVKLFGTDRQRSELVRRFVRADELCCQLFSEPNAGSDLANVGTRAVRDGDEWVVNGQKVWSSGAQFSEWGELIARTDPDVPKHAGMTAFIVPLDLPGIEIRPLRQMSGGSSFNEVFFDDVRVPDTTRLGDVGQGWKVALTTLGFERGGSEGGRSVGGSWARVLGLAQWLGRTGEPTVRQQLAALYIHYRVTSLGRMRVRAATESGQPPGPEASTGKLQWTAGMTMMSDVVSSLLGPRLTADTGEWGTFAWNAHVLGAPGYRIAGGSDEIQRNIIGERVLGLPPEPRVDRNVPWRDVPR